MTGTAETEELDPRVLAIIGAYGRRGAREEGRTDATHAPLRRPEAVADPDEESIARTGGVPPDVGAERWRPCAREDSNLRPAD